MFNAFVFMIHINFFCTFFNLTSASRYYETRRLHEKSDIYSLGIVILELITGRPAVITVKENGDKRHILQWVSFLLATGDIGKIVDPKL